MDAGSPQLGWTTMGEFMYRPFQLLPLQPDGNAPARFGTAPTDPHTRFS